MSEQRKTRIDDATERLTLLLERHQPGARLPTERELCEQLGVGRSTLREAVSRLAALGAIRVVHGRGMFAAARPAAGASHGQLAALLARSAESARGLGLSERELVEAAAAAYRSQEARQAELLLVAPLPSAARAEVSRL